MTEKTNHPSPELSAPATSMQPFEEQVARLNEAASAGYTPYYKEELKRYNDYINPPPFAQEPIEHEKKHGLIEKEHTINGRKFWISQEYTSDDIDTTVTPVVPAAPAPTPQPKPAPAPNPIQAPKPAPVPATVKPIKMTPVPPPTAAPKPKPTPAPAAPAPKPIHNIIRSPEINDGLDIDVASAEKAKYGQDSILVNKNLRLFGVFDGCGDGGGNPKAASQAAKEAIDMHFETEYGDREFTSISEAITAMENAFVAARTAVSEYGEDGLTTASVLKLIVVDGETYAIYGHAGDSRIYHDIQGSPRSTQITRDQGFANKIHNALGADNPAVGDVFSHFLVKESDRLMICTDGITGDGVADSLTPEEMYEAMKGDADTTQDVADRFIKISKKEDDKSVIIIDLDVAPGKAPMAKPSLVPDPPTKPTTVVPPKPTTAPSDPDIDDLDDEEPTLPHDPVTPKDTPEAKARKRKSAREYAKQRMAAMFRKDKKKDDAADPVDPKHRKRQKRYARTLGTVTALVAVVAIAGGMSQNTGDKTQLVDQNQPIKPVGTGNTAGVVNMTDAEIRAELKRMNKLQTP